MSAKSTENFTVKEHVHAATQTLHAHTQCTSPSYGTDMCSRTCAHTCSRTHTHLEKVGKTINLASNCGDLCVLVRPTIEHLRCRPRLPVSKN
jgi:hypothetical protein